MSRRNRKHNHASNSNAQVQAVQSASGSAASAQAFTFGDPVPVLDRRELLDYVECWQNGRWYEPPVDLYGLASTFRSAPHHSSAVYVKRNILAGTFIPHAKFTRRDFAAAALDYLVFGNTYIERLKARSGIAMRYQHALAKYTRRGVENLDQYFFVQYGFAGRFGTQDVHEFDPGSVFQLREPDINQEIYGIPEYLSAIQSALLNESATLFRRKYYLNGSHAGFILYMTDPAQNEADIDTLRDALRCAKGPGNFRNLFMYSPNGKKDGMQLIPVGEVAAKDEFTGIKTASRDDILAAHRVPPQLLGIVPNATSGFGDVIKAAQVFAENELKPLQARFSEINDWAGEEIVRFGKYAISDAAAAA